MNKRRLHHALRQIRKVHTAYFVIAIVIVAVTAVVSLRQNNIVALQLRDEVLQTDKDNGDVEAALKKLREHVYGHMNSNLAVSGGAYPPVQLKYRYERLTMAESERASAANAAIYPEAQAYCESIIPTGRSLNRIDCLNNYILSKGGVSQTAIPDSVYKFDFASPVWSPDLAGWSLVLLAILIVLFIARILTITWLKHTLHE